MTLNKKAFGFASAAAAAALDIFGYIWHGMLQQPSAMNILYPGFWNNSALMTLGLFGSVAGSYVLGYGFAQAYNKAESYKAGGKK